MTTDNTDREELLPCPWCGNTPTVTKIEGSVTNPELVSCRSDFCPMTLAMTPEEWNTRSRAAVASPRRYFSCGGALTADEYIAHYFEMGHDRGEQPRNSAREKLDAIIVRCTDGDLSHDWRAVIGRLAREALASLPPVAPSLIPEQDAPERHAKTCERWVQCGDHEHYESIVNCTCAATPSTATAAEHERCHVWVTGRHRIDPPFCKDCGQTFPAGTVAATLGAGAAAEEICAYFGDPELAMGGHVNANGIAAIISKHFPSTVPVEEQKDGWVTFGRVKVDIENETETFERVKPE